MRVAEAARRLDISVSLTYQLLSSGRLRGTRLGMKRGTWRVSEEAIAEFLKSCEVEGETPPEPAPVRQKLRHLKV